MSSRESIAILMADDDEDDREMAKEALGLNHVHNPVYFVEDGEELTDYLHQRGKYADPDAAPRPGLILLDLNMPRKNGYEVLSEIKADPELRHIPVVVLTTSSEEDDVVDSYGLGANSYITKPSTFDGLVQVVEALNRYWFQLVALPGGTG